MSSGAGTAATTLPQLQYSATLAANLSANQVAQSLQQSLQANSKRGDAGSSAASFSVQSSVLADPNDLNRGKWTTEEDEELRQAVGAHARWPAV